jgi:hypothetical protein
MTELIATIVITASSVLLFGYWFRYTCMLILSAETSLEFARNLATSSQLAFVQVQSQLSEGEANLDRLRVSLDRDYAILSGMLEKTAHLGVNDANIEQRMLQLNYKVAAARFSLTNRFSNSAARGALQEMSMVVAHFANVMGERAVMNAA